MSKIKLRSVLSYSKDKMSYKELNIETYISTDNLLQNKQGVDIIHQLPSSETNTSKYVKGNILVSNIRPYLKKIYYARQEGGVSADVLNFKVNALYDSRFIYYNLFQDSFFDYMMAGSKGTKMPRGDKNQILDFEISNFDLNTQQKIASVLSALDDKIDLNNKINVELEQMAKTLYDYWFVQFDFPNEEGKPYKSSGGKMLYNEVLKREIPEGWEVKRFGDLVDLVRGVSYGKDDIQKSSTTESIPILRATNITGNKIDIDNPILVSKKMVSYDQILNVFDILITMSSGSIDHIGKNGLFLLDKVVSFGAFCAKIVAKNNLKYYIYEYMQSEFVSNTIRNECLGTNINNLNSSMINNFRIIKPDLNHVEQFNSKVNPIYCKIQNNLKQNQELAELRDWLLPMLMNGQVSVGDVVDQKVSTVKSDGRIRDLFGDEEYLRRKALAVYIVNQSLGDKSFGKTKFMKLLHLVEYHIVQGSLEQAYYKHAAGPYDGAFATKFWNEVIEDKWYRIEELGSLNHIISGVNHYDTKDYTSFIEDNLREQIRAFIHIFKDCNYEQPEIVSTLYAVWNNRIIQKEMITDALLKQDFLAWDEQKEKYEDKLDKALVWMRSNKIVPTGWGKVIKASKSRRG
ncbi:Restriction endonuclease S subunit [Myroides marinus]|uniref:Restriction endonuclease S subunit n=1 Tax=Myroides marinus TaxID=703342 RepID=A0A1H6Y948_9FLAO|nr:restriction endonuclease subunit S [Myroides marinus]SEJ35577.1 Restriction endonuclease S subunit [Myroides marinus]